jgi:hypothetical protein
MMHGIDLNQPPHQPPEAQQNAEFTDGGNASNDFVPGPQSEASGNATNEAELGGDEISSQPVVPFVGMVFDHIDEAYDVYNNYAYKLGLGMHIGNTKYSTSMKAPKGTILNRSFECVYSGKPLDEAENGSGKKKATAEEQDPTIDMSTFVGQKARSKQAEAEMDPNDTRQRNKMAPYGCKAHMHVGKRQGQWTCTFC